MKLKNCHSPAGMGYSLQNTRLVHGIDCLKCKHGTLRICDKKAICIDCGQEYTVTLLQKLGVLRS